MPLVDRLLYIYSTILIIALTSGALIDAVAGGGNLLSLLFLLPVLGYLGFQLFATLYRRK